MPTLCVLDFGGISGGDISRVWGKNASLEERFRSLARGHLAAAEANTQWR